jgi:hypothetical protein
MKTLEGGHKNEERGTGRASGAFPIGSENIGVGREVKQTRGRGRQASLCGFGCSLTFGNSGDIIINSIPVKAGQPCGDIDCILE